MSCNETCSFSNAEQYCRAPNSTSRELLQDNCYFTDGEISCKRYVSLIFYRIQMLQRCTSARVRGEMNENRERSDERETPIQIVSFPPHSSS